MSVRDLIPWTRGRDQNAVNAFGNDQSDPFVAFHREFDRLFEDFWRSAGTGLPSVGAFGEGLSRGWPSVEISETDKDIQVSAEVPGLDEKDVELLLENGTLTIRGERSSENEDKDKQFSERFYGRFERRIPLPVEIDEEKVEAKFSNGVLNITLPKSEKAQAEVKRINIRH